MNIPEQGTETISQSDEFICRISELLDNGLSDDALSEILDDENDYLVHLCCLDIYQVVFGRMRNSELMISDPDLWACMDSILEYLTKTCKPKEALIALLEQSENIESDAMYHLVTSLLKIVFIRLPNKRGDDSFLWALNALYGYVAKLPLPENNYLEENESAILENCPILTRLEQSVTSALTFCEPFISEAKDCSRKVSPVIRNARTIQLATFLLKLLERPVSYFEVRPRKSYKSAFDNVAQVIIQMLSHLTPNFFVKIVRWQQNNQLSLACRLVEESTIDQTSVSDMAIGVLAYFLFADGYCLETLPCVYSNEYLFSITLPYCIQMMRFSTVDTILNKSLKLLDARLRPITLNSWTKEDLEQKDFQNLIFGLINVMQRCSLLSGRQKALSCFNDYLQRFDIPGQISLVTFIHYKSDNLQNCPIQAGWMLGDFSGILGWLTDWYRNKLTNDITGPYADYVKRMTSLFCHLEEEEKTDLLDIFDRTMASLNFVRFLGLRGADFNLSHNLVDDIKKTYLNVIGRAIELSVAHYKLELKQGRQENSNSDFDHTQLDLLETALTRFDLISGVLARVNQLFNK